MVSAERASRSVGWVGLEIASLLVLSLATLIVLARLLGPEEFGIAALAVVTIQFLTVFTRATFLDALVHRERLESDHLNAAFWAGLATAVLLVGLCVLAAPGLGRLFDEPVLPAVFAWTALSLLFTGTDGVPVALLRRELRMKELALRAFYGRLAGAVVGIAMAFAGYGVWALVAQQIAIEATHALAGWWLAGWRPALRRPSLPHLRDLTGFALPWLGGELLLTGTPRVFNLLVGYLFGTTALGYVNIGFRTVGMLGQTLEVAAHQLAMPIFARLQGNLVALRDAFRRASALVSFLVLPGYAGVIVCAEPVVVALLGVEWTPAIPLIQLIAAATFLQVLVGLTSSVYSAVGRPIWRLWRGALDLALTVVGLLALAGLGPLAAGVVWLGRFAALVPFSCYGMWRLVGAGALSQLRVVTPSMAAAGLMAGVLLVVQEYLPPDWSAAQALSVLVPLGAVLYFTAFAAIAWGELRQYLGYGRLALTSGPREPDSGRAPTGRSA